MPTPAWPSVAADDDDPEWRTLGREYEACRRTLILHTPSWSSYTPLHAISWQKVKYDSAAQPVNRRGVYAFVLDASVVAGSHFPPMSTILYVGETGDTSGATLRSRLTNYRNINSQIDRVRIYNMLKIWKEDLYFYCADLPTGVSTKAFETVLLDAVLPPGNKKDFSATVSKALDHAFRK